MYNLPKTVSEVENELDKITLKLQKINDDNFIQISLVRISYKNGYVSENWFSEFDIKRDSNGKVTKMNTVSLFTTKRPISSNIDDIVTIDLIDTVFVKKEKIEKIEKVLMRK